jgi:hypothetical protein
MTTADKPSPTVWREGDLVVARRDQPLPPLCLLSGRPASRRVPCLFHWRDRLPSSGGAGGLVEHYVRDVWKAPLAIPLADHLILRRRIGWTLCGLAALLAVGTIMGIIAAQNFAHSLPAGPEKKWWRDLGVPLVTVGGFIPLMAAALGSYYIMPHLTVRLKPQRIDDKHIWLAGAAPEYLAQLPERPDRWGNHAESSETSNA